MFEFDFLTVDMLATPIGLAMAVSLLTQFTKDMLDRIKKVRTKYIVYIYAEVLMFATLLVTKEVSGFTWRDWLAQVIVVVLNGMVVALASMKSYEEVADYIVARYMSRAGGDIEGLEIEPQERSDCLP